MSKLVIVSELMLICNFKQIPVLPGREGEHQDGQVETRGPTRDVPRGHGTHAGRDQVLPGGLVQVHSIFFVCFLSLLFFNFNSYV